MFRSSAARVPALLAPVILSVSLASSPFNTQPKSKGNVANGKKLYSATCVACHGPAGKGLKGLGKDLTKSTFVKSKTDPQLVAFLKVGRPSSDKLNTTGVDMPPKGGNPSLDDKKLLDIVAYIRALK